MRLLMALVVLIAAACAPASPLQPLPAPPVTAQPIANPSDAASCKTAGGSWRPICRMQTPACVFTYADAGKACTDSTQCQGGATPRRPPGRGRRASRLRANVRPIATPVAAIRSSRTAWRPQPFAPTSLAGAELAQNRIEPACDPLSEASEGATAGA